MTVEIARGFMVGFTDAGAGVTVTTPPSSFTVLTNRPWTTSRVDGEEPAAPGRVPLDCDWVPMMDPPTMRVVANTPAMNHRQVRPVVTGAAMGQSYRRRRGQTMGMFTRSAATRRYRELSPCPRRSRTIAR